MFVEADDLSKGQFLVLHSLKDGSPTMHAGTVMEVIAIQLPFFAVRLGGGPVVHCDIRMVNVVKANNDYVQALLSTQGATCGTNISSAA